MCSFYKIFYLFLVLFFCLACGGDGSSPPVFNDSGVCLANCPDINGPDKGKDGFKSDLADIDGGDQPPDGSTDQPEVEPYVCPSEIPPLEQYEACMPVGAKKAFCTLLAPPPTCAGGFHEFEPCTADSFCQQVPPDKWPPCVCWGLPCELVGLYRCDKFNFIKVSLSTGDGATCKIQTTEEMSDETYFYYVKPGEPNPIDFSNCQPINGWECHDSPSGIGIHCTTW